MVSKLCSSKQSSRQGMSIYHENGHRFDASFLFLIFIFLQGSNEPNAHGMHDPVVTIQTLVTVLVDPR